MRTVPSPAQDKTPRVPETAYLRGGWGEELQRDAVRVAETQSRAVVGVHDAAVLDAELIQLLHPSFQLRTVRAPEADMVETNLELGESPALQRPVMLVDAEQRAVLERPDRVPETGVGLFVDGDRSSFG